MGKRLLIIILFIPMLVLSFVVQLPIQVIRLVITGKPIGYPWFWTMMELGYQSNLKN